MTTAAAAAAAAAAADDDDDDIRGYTMVLVQVVPQWRITLSAPDDLRAGLPLRLITR